MCHTLTRYFNRNTYTPSHSCNLAFRLSCDSSKMNALHHLGIKSRLRALDQTSECRENMIAVTLTLAQFLV